MEEILRRLISFQTVTGQPQPAHELIEYVADFVRHRGMHIERYTAGGFESLVATTKPHDKTPTVLLAAHGDVVSAPNELFDLRQENGKYYGRGVVDMKSSLAAFLQIIDDIQDNIDSYNFGLVVTTDEEQGGQYGIKKIVEEGYRPKVCIIPDGGDNWQVQVSAKGIYNYRITAYGTSVHSSRHWQGVNALNALLPVIPRLEAMFPDQGPSTNTLSINVINAGSDLTRVPDLASLIIDVRTINWDEHLRIDQAVRSLCSELGLEIELVADGDPTACDLTDPYIAPYVSLIEQTTGIKVVGSNTLGTNDIRYFQPLNIPCVSFYPTGGDHHSSNEWVAVEAVEQIRSITRSYLDTIAR